jgi:DNA-binding response OmpR family regulator
MLQKILVIENDPSVCALLARCLPGPTTEVHIETSGACGLRRAADSRWDLFIVDRCLPDFDGLQLCKQIRADRHSTGAIFLAGDGSEQDRIASFDAGADDYICKPFSVAELKARICARLRHSESNAQLRSVPTSRPDLEPLRVGKLFINPRTREVECGGMQVPLTAKEMQLLHFLVQHRDQAWTRDQLLARIWGIDFEGYAHTVSSHVNRLRAKLQLDPTQPSMIVTVWGAGYRFNNEISGAPTFASQS